MRMFVPAVLAAAMASLALAAHAAPPFPSKPVRIVIPVPPGGVQDLLARSIGQELSKAWNQPVVTENRAGAGGVAAADAVAKSDADGHTILMSDEVPHAITPVLVAKLPYDPINDFTPIAALVQSSHVLVVSSASSAGSVRELLEMARAKPSELHYGSFGVGSTGHLNTEELGALAGARFTHVPYKGGADILRALVAGDIQFAITGLTPARPLIKQGRLKPIAYTGTRRLADMPDLPTVAESGVPGFSTQSWFGWVARAGTPGAIVDRIAADALRVVATPEFRDRYLRPAGLETLGYGPQEFQKLLQDTRVKYDAQLKRLNFKPQ